MPAGGSCGAGGRAVFEHFTDRARTAVVEAQRQAQGLRHGYIGTEHLLLGVLATGDNVGARALSRLGVGTADVRRDVVRIIGEGPSGALGADDERALGSIGIDLDQVRRALDAAFGPGALDRPLMRGRVRWGDRKSTRLNSSHVAISYAVFCLKKKSAHALHRSPQGGRPRSAWPTRGASSTCSLRCVVRDRD